MTELPHLTDNERSKTDRDFLKDLFREYSAWARHYHDQSTKVNLVFVLVSGAVIGLTGNDIRPIHGMLLMILATGAILITTSHWSRYEYNNKLAVKIRKAFVEQNYFTDRIWRRAERNFRAESPMLAKMRFRKQFVYWFIVHLGVLLIGGFAVLTG